MNLRNFPSATTTGRSPSAIACSIFDQRLLLIRSLIANGFECSSAQRCSETEANALDVTGLAIAGM
jgi:hypothetical protein